MQNFFELLFLHSNVKIKAQKSFAFARCMTKISKIGVQRMQKVLHSLFAFARCVQSYLSCRKSFDYAPYLGLRSSSACRGMLLCPFSSFIPLFLMPEQWPTISQSLHFFNPTSFQLTCRLSVGSASPANNFPASTRPLKLSKPPKTISFQGDHDLLVWQK